MLQELFDKYRPVGGGPCPHCGYCPHCGRGGWRWPQPAPYWSEPIPQFPTPIWVSDQTTVGGGVLGSSTCCLPPEDGEISG